MKFDIPRMVHACLLALQAAAMPARNRFAVSRRHDFAALSRIPLPVSGGTRSAGTETRYR